MMYLSDFIFPDIERETSFFMAEKRTCYDSFYPFKVLSARGVKSLRFEPITLLYGGNGCGKTTALNVIAEKLRLQRDTLYNRSNFFQDYVDMCHYETRQPITPDSRVITSDDVFDYMMNVRTINEGIDRKREELFVDYLDNKYAKFQLRSMADYEKLKKITMARGNTQSKYVRKNLMDNVRELSNGESAYFYFTDKIKEPGLYLLDEPENSLSPARQQDLTKFLEESVRFFDCQFIISTHSPFLLAMHGARVYDLDADPARVRRWTELPAVQTYYRFFKEHTSDFEIPQEG